MKKKVLVADDSCSFRKIVREIIEENNNVEVSEVSNGKEAFYLLQNGEFDLLITDVHMPKMNGVELVDKLRASGSYIPIIVLSALLDYQMRDYFNGQKSVYIIEKPFQINILTEIIKIAGENNY